MENKVLIGVKRYNEKELDWVKEILEKYSPSKVGLGLPKDHLEREMYGVNTALLSDLASHLKEKGVDIVPLEHPKLLDYFHALDYAKAVIDGKIKKEELEANVKMTEKREKAYMAPEVLYPIMHFLERDKTALKILAGNQTSEGVQNLWEDSINDRQAYILGRIMVSDVDVVVVPDVFTESIKLSLPDFEYVESPIE